MLAQGNGRADGSTVIQNSRIVLSGDDGRRISYRISALKDNTLEVSLGHGICRIVLGGDFSDIVTRWHPMGR